MVSRLCLFAHFDPQGQVAAYVERYLNALATCGFDIVFITPTTLTPEGRALVEPLCLDVIERENAGLDFGSWQVGFERYADLADDELLLANDSVYGPVGDLGEALTRLRALPGDIRGFVRSEEPRPHLQSWFLLLTRPAFNSDTFRRFMAQDFASMSKQAIIEHGEVGLLDALVDQGLTLSASYAPSPEYAHRLISLFNPTHVLWRELIETYGVPFVKVELLRDNPDGISDVGLWRDVVTPRAPELTPMIEAHRAASGRVWAGAVPKARRRGLLSHEGFVRRDEALRERGSVWRRRRNADLLALLTHSYRAYRAVKERLVRTRSR